MAESCGGRAGFASKNPPPTTEPREAEVFFAEETHNAQCGNENHDPMITIPLP